MSSKYSLAKVVQGLSQSTSNPAVLPAIGWYSIESLIGKPRIDFLLRILLLERDNGYKSVLSASDDRYLDRSDEAGPQEVRNDHKCQSLRL